MRLLNRKLAEAEAWIRQRRDRCLADYYRAGGVGGRRGKHCFSDTLWEDVELEVDVTCVLRDDHPDFDEEDDNIVCELDWSSFDGIVDDPVNHDWNVFQFEPGHPLGGERHCWLFHDLVEHVLRFDWDPMLGIGGIWLDVRLIQQWGMSW
ncbi:hypothetical protein CY652_23000 [Burkholderia sp. WAC0059]|nr:hypothetical protein CY652_23000 [Burkholderia sp. WAC0059]